MNGLLYKKQLTLIVLQTMGAFACSNLGQNNKIKEILTEGEESKC